MYQVIRMYGDNQPWWFFEDWEQDIQNEKTFTSFAEAEKFYQEAWSALRKEKKNMEGKPNYLCAFWNDQDERWCEECGDYITQYTGLALLKDHKAVVNESGKEFYQKNGHEAEVKCCKRRLAKI